MSVIEKDDLTLEDLRKALDYDPRSGNFYWKIRPSARIRVGDVAGSQNRKPQTTYLDIRVYGRRYQAHRLAFFWMSGEWPKNHVDHIDRDGLNNSWDNLREATHSQNLANAIFKKKNTICKSKGVRLQEGRYNARISVNKKRINLGSFASEEQAAAAYAAAANIYFGEFARSEN